MRKAWLSVLVAGLAVVSLAGLGLSQTLPARSDGDPDQFASSQVHRESGSKPSLPLGSSPVVPEVSIRFKATMDRGIRQREVGQRRVISITFSGRPIFLER